MTKAELLSRMSNVELLDWMVYAEWEPFGEERADLRMGILAAVTANGGRKKGQRAFKASDFIPKFGPKEPQSFGQMMAAAKAWTKLAQAQQKNKRGAP